MELPPAKKAGSKEVSGEADGVTLAECLADGRVPVPDRMSFPKWQQWRKADGRRPIKRKDGVGLSTAEEVALWRATMEALYGEKEADEADESEDDDSSELRPGAAPPAALVPVHGAARSVGSSPRPSSAGTGPVEIEQLQKELYGMYDPVMEDLSEYLERVTRLVLALKTLGHNVSAVDLERITMKAEMLREACDLVGPEPKLLVRALRERFTRLALDEVLGEQEKSVQVGCIGELILGLGGKESAASDKLFSTPSIEDGAVGLPTRSATKSGGLGEPRVGLAADRGDGGESPLRAKVAALEMELEALKRGSEVSGPEKDMVLALEAQTKVLQEALTSRGAGGGGGSVTSVKADLQWPTLTDERSEARDVALFYEEFEDVCALANNCKGMSFREQLLALRARCRGSRLKAFTNIYRSAWKSGEILDDPESVYRRIKNKHLVFAESREEKEVRIDAEHAALAKGRLSACQFEPLFESSISELESVGLGKTTRELYLSYLRKMPAHLQKEIRGDKRLWGVESTLRGPQTWEEAHRVVLEIEQREATHKATANSILNTDVSGSSADKPLAKLKEELKKAKDEAKRAKEAAAKAKASSTLAISDGGKSQKLCFHFRDHGSCPKGDRCPWSHDKELRKKVLAEMKSKSDSTLTSKGGKGKGRGKGKGKGGGKTNNKGSDGRRICPFFQRNGSCKKGAGCDMVHALPAASSNSAGNSQAGGIPDGWSAPTGGPSAANPFASFSVVIGDEKPDLPRNSAVLASAPAADKKQPFTSLDQIPSDWFQVVENERGGYQYRTSVRVLDKLVETMLDGCAGSNHVTEELVCGMLNRAATLGITPQDKRFPVVRFEKWVYPEYVHGIASGASVPLKGAVVLRVRLMEGKSVENATEGPEIFVRCKVAARGTSDWHGLILGGRALDCEAKRGLGFRPGPDCHILDGLGIQIPRCEDSTNARKDRAYPFVSVLSSVDGSGSFEPGGGDRQLLRYDAAEPAVVSPGDGLLVPVRRDPETYLDGSLCEAVLPIQGGKVETIPGIWDTGATHGMVLVASASGQDETLEQGDAVAEVRQGLVESAICSSCGLMDTRFTTGNGSCQSCGIAQPASFEECEGCGDKIAPVSLQGCGSCKKTASSTKSSTRKLGFSLLCTFAAVSLFSFGTDQSIRDPEVLTFLDSLPGPGWWNWKDGWCEWAGPGVPGVSNFSDKVEACPYRVSVSKDTRSGVWNLLLARDHRLWKEHGEFPDEHVDATVVRFYLKSAPAWAGWCKGCSTSGLGISRVEGQNTRTNPIYHIVESVDMEKMAEETPTDFYYDVLRKDMGQRYPRADPHLLDHLVSLEGFLDKSIIFGFSFGISKAEICVTEGKLLGHNIGRYGSSPDKERCQAVVDFPPLKEKLHIQQFLGCSNWLRPYLPAEYGLAAKILGAYQKAGSEFPPDGLGSSDSEGCKAVKCIKKMLCECIGLSVFDEASAADGSCPLEQIADASGIAVGGTVLQMSRDLSRMKVLMTHSKSLTPAQQNWPPLIQEAYAQLEVKRATRKMFGSIKTLCWTDHANLTRAQSSDIGADIKLVRWVSEILADGSEIRSLSGRSAKLGDGFSRNPAGRDELLEARTKDIAGVAGQLKKFNLDEYLGEGTETTSSVPWAIGDDAVPDPAVVGSSSVMALVGSSEVRVLVAMDYQKLKDGNAVLKDASRLLEQALPGISVGMRACYGPFEDDEGCCSHFDGAVARLPAGNKKNKRMRVDLLTSCAKVLREVAAYKPDLILGFGQGGVVVALLRWPLVVELTLQARNLQTKEVREIGSSWGRIKAVWSVNPRVWRTQLGATEVKEAIPELLKDFVVDPLNGFGVATKTGRPDELDAMFEALRLEKITSVAAVGIRGMLAEPGREVWEHDGLCSCGKKTYLFSRCPACIEKEAQDEVVEMQERADAAESRDIEDDLDLALEVGALVAATEGAFGFKRIPCSLVKQWAVSGRAAEDRTQAQVKLGVLEVRKWKNGVKAPAAQLKSAEHPFVTGWVLVSDACLLSLHHCCKKENVRQITSRWSVEQVNWHNHRYVVDEVCSRLWEDPRAVLPFQFTRILGLVGEVVRVEGWNDGDGKESLGHRKSLKSRLVLACFSLMPSGHWDFIHLSRRIRVQEGPERRTIAFVGREWTEPRVVVYLHSKEWICTDWTEPVKERKVAVLTAADDVAERERLAEEAKARLGISEFHVSGSLRSAWYEAQRRDGSLAGILRKTEHPFVLGGDGLLEREVQLAAGRVVRAAVVPTGVAGANGLTWRRACYNQVHCGILGAHRSAKVTIQLLERQVWWATLQEDVKRWTETCLACLKGRGRPTRVESKAVKCTADCCWQEVSVDCEGPNREDRHGYRYSLTYFCCLSHAVMLEPLKSLTHAEVRRGFSRCVLRSRTIPTLLRSDRGVEFRNGLMTELTALLGIQQRFSMALRPCEMGSNERMHQEVQKVLGALMREVGSLENWSDWLVVAEYVLDNTPGPHGYTPRDLERSWSLSLPLEKDVLRHTLEFEPVSDWAQRQFSGFKEIAALVSKHWDKASEARTKLANRFRRQIELKIGDRVVWKSPTARPEGAGRVPWKPGLNGPWEVVRVQGNRLLLRPCRPELPQKDLLLQESWTKVGTTCRTPYLLSVVT